MNPMHQSQNFSQTFIGKKIHNCNQNLINQTFIVLGNYHLWYSFLWEKNSRHCDSLEHTEFQQEKEAQHLHKHKHRIQS
jgi:hypothetical protein